MKIMKILKKAGGILLVIIGILFFVSALKMIFVDNPKTKAALKDAVYVDAADTIDPENDGKTVIVCGTFELTKPAHDDELGLDFDSIRISSSKQTMKLTKSSSKKKEAIWRSGMEFIFQQHAGIRPGENWKLCTFAGFY